MQHHQTMAQLQHRVSPRDKIVGWFSTGDPDASRSRDALIHSFYGNECPNPVRRGGGRVAAPAAADTSMLLSCWCHCRRAAAGFAASGWTCCC